MVAIGMKRGEGERRGVGERADSLGRSAMIDRNRPKSIRRESI